MRGWDEGWLLLMNLSTCLVHQTPPERPGAPCGTHWDIELDTALVLHLGKSKAYAGFISKISPFILSRHSLRHKSQRICLSPTWKGLWLHSKPGIFCPIRETWNTPNIPVPPVGRKSSKIYSSERQTPKALGKANVIHLSHSITEAAVIQHIHCFSLFRQKRANCPGSELNICFTKQRY